MFLTSRLHFRAKNIQHALQVESEALHLAFLLKQFRIPQTGYEAHRIETKTLSND